MSATFDIGDEIRLAADFVDEAGAPDDPDAVTIRVRHPSGAVDVYSGAQLTSSVVGTWTRLIDLDGAGRWYWRAEGSANPQAAAERAFTVRGSQLV
jgi:hypothetical protein